MSLDSNIRNKKNIGSINFEEKFNNNPNFDKESNNQKDEILNNYDKYDYTEIEIKNNDDY